MMVILNNKQNINALVKKIFKYYVLILSQAHSMNYSIGIVFQE